MDEQAEQKRWSTKRTSNLPRGVFTKAGSPYYWIRYSTGQKDDKQQTILNVEVTTFKVDERGALSKAKALVEERRVSVRRGEAPVIDGDATFEQLAAAVLEDYKFKQHRSLNRVRQHVANLTPFFKGKKAKDITPRLIKQYALWRQEQVVHRRKGRRGTATARKPANATINNELRTLRRGFHLNKDRMARIPKFDFLTVDNIRKGFFERHELDAILPELPLHMQGPVEFMYVTGWRVNSEVLTRQWKHVDFKRGWVSLEPGETKNKEARVFPLLPPLRDLLMRQRLYVDGLQKETGKIIPWVFPKADGEPFTHTVNGEVVFKWPYTAWQGACKRAKIGEKLAHDFRRTAIRNMIRAGIDRRVAMKLSGHKTEGIFNRYNITEEADLEEAAVKLAARLKEEEGQERKVVLLKKEG